MLSKRFPPDDPREWLNRAKSNLAKANIPSETSGIYLEDLCFDAQQAAEKALKSVLIHLDVQFPRSRSGTVAVTCRTGEPRRPRVYWTSSRFIRLCGGNSLPRPGRTGDLGGIRGGCRYSRDGCPLGRTVDWH